MSWLNAWHRKAPDGTHTDKVTHTFRASLLQAARRREEEAREAAADAEEAARVEVNPTELNVDHPSRSRRRSRHGRTVLVQNDEKEADRRAEDRQRQIAAANQKLWLRAEEVRDLHSRMLLSEVLAEREAQLALKQQQLGLETAEKQDFHAAMLASVKVSLIQSYTRQYAVSWQNCKTRVGVLVRGEIQSPWKYHRHDCKQQLFYRPPLPSPFQVTIPLSLTEARPLENTMLIINCCSLPGGGGKRGRQDS